MLSGAVAGCSTSLGIAPSTNYHTPPPHGHRRQWDRRCTRSPRVASPWRSGAGWRRTGRRSAFPWSPRPGFATSSASCAGSGPAKVIVNHEGPAGEVAAAAPRERSCRRAAHRTGGGRSQDDGTRRGNLRFRCAPYLFSDEATTSSVAARAPWRGTRGQGSRQRPHLGVPGDGSRTRCRRTIGCAAAWAGWPRICRPTRTCSSGPNGWDHRGVGPDQAVRTVHRCGHCRADRCERLVRDTAAHRRADPHRVAGLGGQGDHRRTARRRSPGSTTWACTPSSCTARVRRNSNPSCGRTGPIGRRCGVPWRRTLGDSPERPRISAGHPRSGAVARSGSHRSHLGRRAPS